MIKLFTVMFTSLLSFTLVYLPYFINFISTFGTKIFDIPIAFMSDYNLLTSSVTVGEYIAILCIVHLVVTLTATTVIFMLSMLLKNNIMTMIVTSGIILIPCLVAMELTDVRMVTAFQNNIWQTVVTVIVSAGFHRLYPRNRRTYPALPHCPLPSSARTSPPLPAGSRRPCWRFSQKCPFPVLPYR